MLWSHLKLRDDANGSGSGKCPRGWRQSRAGLEPEEHPGSSRFTLQHIPAGSRCQQEKPFVLEKPFFCWKMPPRKRPAQHNPGWAALPCDIAGMSQCWGQKEPAGWKGRSLSLFQEFSPWFESCISVTPLLLEKQGRAKPRSSENPRG